MNELDNPKSIKVLITSGNEFENSFNTKALVLVSIAVLSLNFSSLKALRQLVS